MEQLGVVVKLKSIMALRQGAPRAEAAAASSSHTAKSLRRTRTAASGAPPSRRCSGRRTSSCVVRYGVVGLLCPVPMTI